HHKPCTLIGTAPLDWRAAPLSGSICSDDASTASKLAPAIDLSSSKTRSGQRVSETPWKYQLLPPSASTRPYFFIARRITCVRASKREMSKALFKRKRAPIGGRVESALVPDPCRAGHK